MGTATTLSWHLPAPAQLVFASTDVPGRAGKGPGIVNVTRENRDRVITVTTPGCTPSTALVKSVDSKFFINILTGGTFGSSTDYRTGEMWKYADSVVITCK